MRLALVFITEPVVSIWYGIGKNLESPKNFFLTFLTPVSTWYGIGKNLLKSKDLVLFTLFLRAIALLVLAMAIN